MTVYSNYEVYPAYFDELPDLKEVCPFNFECETCGYDCEVDVDVE